MQQAILEALGNFANHSTVALEDSFVDCFLAPQPSISTLNAIFSKWLSKDATSDEDGNLKVVLLAGTILDLATRIVTKSRRTLQAGQLEAFMELTGSLFSLSSVLIQSGCVQFWLATVKRLEDASALIGSRLLPAFLARLARGESWSGSLDRDSFANKAQFDEMQTVLQNRLLDGLKLMAAHCPLVYCNTVLATFEHFYSFSGGARFLSEGASSNELVLQWRTIVSSIDCFGKAFSNPDSLSSVAESVRVVLVRIQEGLLQMFSSLESVNGHLLQRWIVALRAISLFIPERLPVVVQLLLQTLFTFDQKDPTNKYDIENEVRGQCSTLLLRVAKSHVEAFSPFNEIILRAACEDCGSSDAKTLSIKKAMFELLLILGNDGVSAALHSVSKNFDQLKICFNSIQSVAVFQSASADLTQFRRILCNCVVLILVTTKHIAAMDNVSKVLTDFCLNSQDFLLAFLSWAMSLYNSRRDDSVHIWREMFREDCGEDASESSLQIDQPQSLQWFSTVLVSSYISLGMLSKMDFFYSSGFWLNLLDFHRNTSANLFISSAQFKHFLPNFIGNIDDKLFGQQPQVLASLRHLLASSTNILTAEIANSQKLEVNNADSSLSITHKNRQINSCANNILVFLFDFLIPKGERGIAIISINSLLFTQIKYPSLL